MIQTQNSDSEYLYFGLESNMKQNDNAKEKEMIDIQDQGPTQRQCYVVIVWAPGE